MGSALHLKRESPISKEDWIKFCDENDVIYSPMTVGRNVWYFGGMGGIEIHFEGIRSGDKMPDSSDHIYITTFFCKYSNFGMLGDITKTIAKSLSFTISHIDDELRSLFTEEELSHLEVEDEEEYIDPGVVMEPIDKKASVEISSGTISEPINLATAKSIRELLSGHSHTPIDEE